MVLPSTWSTSCFMGQTPLLKTPQGTLLFTFVPFMIRQVRQQNPLPLSIITVITVALQRRHLVVCLNHLNESLSLSLANQESSVRVLLYRGANKEARNKHGQTPFQVNDIHGNIQYMLIRLSILSYLCLENILCFFEGSRNGRPF